VSTSASSGGLIIGETQDPSTPTPGASRLGHKYGRIRSMRTTVDIPNHMYQRLKSRAAREGSSAKALILRGVEQVLSTRSGVAARARRVKLPLVRSKRPGTVQLDNAKIYEVISFP
jgi:hypothetical protein